MPPRIKVHREEILDAALRLARRKGADAVTARELAGELHTSVGPIFTSFDSMEQLRAALYELARENYLACIERGLAEPVPFLGLWKQHIRFAREERELYRLLFLSRPGAVSGGAMEALRVSRELARPSLMRVCHMDAHAADCCFRDLWLTAFSFAALIVTDDCPYTDEEIFAVGTEIGLAVCKAYKEIPGLPEGRYDRDAILAELAERSERREDK